MKAPKLYIVVPWFNEKLVVDGIVPRFRGVLGGLVASGKVEESSRLLFVDDGSVDGTAGLLKAWADRDDGIELLTLPRNEGQQSAIVHGLRMARGHGADVVVTMDCDGQDDLESVEKMVDAYLAGDKVVYGVRNDRSSDTFLKRTTALMFYRVMRLLGGRLVFNHAEFRLMDAEVVDAVVEKWRKGMFLRAIIPTLGFRSSVVEYRRMARPAGRTHYGFAKLVRIALSAMMESLRRRH